MAIEEHININIVKNIDMRYGENPHQMAAFFISSDAGVSGLGHLYTEGKLHGKELSYNNIADISAAIRMLTDLDDNSCIVIKHSNPCGAASRDTCYESFKAAYEGDSMSIFGGIVGFKGVVDEKTAEFLHGIFLEIIIAESFTKEAIEILTKKKNLRLIEYKKWKNEIFKEDQIEIKKVIGGYLLQNRDTINPKTESFNLVTERKATEQELDDLVFAQIMVKHVKSNAIVIVKNKMLLGVGAGQMNRVTAANIAMNWAGEKVKNAVLGSDAFFPMDDTVRTVATKGIVAIVQPGGSVKDEDSIKACNELGLSMYFTGVRHFYH
ncbi:MAG: hypothetical protein A2015_06615 [Spirochaetes bacterium GWF1_31_7]|nr:MAG: hypothetical protein A2Y30_09845 [Spirochaetes bacterium GWE1_32_154]OHD46513.1 MAG: hypothetical protein A2015_06615 [Spirochaetes bacterium GWF1_31_7]OHD49322.1 MAG: hypothetical protein A2Y29_03610 [Spirochaetes bacterium GWE2_31_10]OHD76975.1 MAG: hypothetical protein A2355_04525 [Spirochaetes bacterium RIFOXYB1_FULL_32_8]HBD96429.1 hypothetical protein [Spirochaetia bacterium]